jgi:hypothetical protein
MKMVYNQSGDDGIVMISGNRVVHTLADALGMKRYITTEEVAAVVPQLIPLSANEGFFSQERTQIVARAEERLGNDLIQRLRDMELKLSSVLVFGTPFMFETHM